MPNYQFNTSDVPKTTWSYCGRNFLVEVIRWSYEGSEETEVKWNVGMYIYPQHPIFPLILDVNGTGMPDLHVNGYWSLKHWYRNNLSEVTSKHYESDYQHIWDKEYPSSDKSVHAFCEAKRLFDQLLGVESEGLKWISKED